MSIPRIDPHPAIEPPDWWDKEIDIDEDDEEDD